MFHMPASEPRVGGYLAFSICSASVGYVESNQVSRSQLGMLNQIWSVGLFAYICWSVAISALPARAGA